jgi:hypothetical protein
MAAPMRSYRSGWRVGDEPVRSQGERTGADPGPAAVLAHPLPDQPGTADLGDCGQDEQQGRPSERHAAWSQ